MPCAPACVRGRVAARLGYCCVPADQRGRGYVRGLLCVRAACPVQGHAAGACVRGQVGRRNVAGQDGLGGRGESPGGGSLTGRLCARAVLYGFPSRS